MSLQEGVRAVGGHYYVIKFYLLVTPAVSGLSPEHATTWVTLSYLGQDQSRVRLPRYGWPSGSHHFPPKLSLKNQVRILPRNVHSPNSCESFSEQSPLDKEIDRVGVLYLSSLSCI